jgi:hypothetical protein
MKFLYNDVIKCSIELNSDLKYINEEKANLRRLTYEIIDSLIIQINIMFKDFEKLEFVEITNEKKCLHHIKFIF